MTQNKNSISIDVRDFGAAGDNTADDTPAIQKAIDAAAEVQGTVWFPPGQYRCGRLHLKSHVCLAGSPTWAYRRHGGTVIRLNDSNASSLIDMTGSVGARVSGLALDGCGLGSNTHGIYINGAGHNTEDTLVIEKCRVADFTGDGAHLEQAWGFTVRHSMFSHNRGDGIMLTHWDGWILDNIMIGNGKFGLAARTPSASVTVTANRIEWNRLGGILLEGSNHFNINGNFIDRSGGPAILMHGNPDNNDQRWLPGTAAITGNIFNRSGARSELKSEHSSHIWLEDIVGVTCTGNTFCFGNNDDGTGPFSPAYGIVLKKLRSSIITANAMHNAAVEKLILDKGGHDSSTVIRDNPGCVAPTSEHTDA